MDDNSIYSILIVDDDMADLEALNEILKKDYIIYFAKSGKSALKRAIENKPDIILLDVIMPDMDGFEVLAEFKKNDFTSHIPVIFITGLSGVQDEEKGFNLGAVDYITKPFHSSIVKARINSHLVNAKKLRNKDEASIVVKTRQFVRNVFFRELIYIDVSGHWLNFHLINGELVELYASLKEYEDVFLADARFAHCHKSFIINMDFVEAVEVKSVLLKNGERVPISRGFSDFKKKYIQWISG